MKRNRKLTWIEKRRINKIAFDHPYFDIHGTTLTNKEVDSIIKTASDKKTGKEVVTEAYLKAGIPLPEYTEKESFSFVERLIEVFTMRTLKKSIVIAIASILLVVFFAFTPAGHAVAETIYQIIVDIIDGAIHAHNEPADPVPSDYDFTTLPSDIDNPYDLAKKMNYPVIISSRDEVISFSMEIESKYSITLLTEYCTPDGHEYSLLQEIYSSSTLWGSASSSGDVRELNTGFGLHVYIVSDDFSSSILGYEDNYSIDIAVSGSFEIAEEIIQTLVIAD